MVFLNSIHSLVDKLSNQYIEDFLVKGFDIYLKEGDTLSDTAKQAFQHKGLYAFIITKDKRTGIVYVGKSEGEGRIRQHLTGKNKDGTTIAPSVHTKNKEIKNAIKNGYNIKLALISDEQFTKSSLSCLEIECIIKGKEQLKSTQINEKTWNKRT